VTDAGGHTLTRDDLLLGLFLSGVLIWGSLWIDPGWKDARKEVPLLDRVLRPFFPFFEAVDAFLGVLSFVYYACFALRLVVCVILALR
jgi:hypothetical protein